MLKTMKKIVPLILLFGLALGMWSTLIEPGHIKYKEYSITLKNWPAALSGYSIAFITDPHVGSPHITLNKLREIVKKTNAIEPDLILLGGDYVIQEVIGGTPVRSSDTIAILAELHARNGVFGILGNHDRWDNAARIQREFTEYQVPLLENDATHIRVADHGFWIVGISDYSEGAHDIAKALAPINGNDPVILLTHSPDIFPHIPSNIALTLAGHTHGGQVYIPFIGRPIIPSRYGQRYAKGLVEEEGHQIFIGSGIGTSILPLRFMTPPEVSIIKIFPAK